MSLTIIIYKIEADDNGKVSIHARVTPPKFNPHYVSRSYPGKEEAKMQAAHDAKLLLYSRLHLGTAQIDQTRVDNDEAGRR